MKMKNKKSKYYLPLLLVIVIFHACKKDVSLGYEEPIISALNVEPYGTSAMCSAKVSFPGSKTVMVELSDNAEMNNFRSINMTENGGLFSVLVDELDYLTDYYWRVKVCNSYIFKTTETMPFTTFELPSVSIREITNVSFISASCSCSIISDGGLEVKECGVCWNVSGNPTLDDNHSACDSLTDSFSADMFDLMANTKYYIRAYAVSNAGTGYSSEMSFTTEPLPIFMISVESNDLNLGSVSGGGSYEYGRTCTVIANAADGCRFVFWSENGNLVSSEASYSFTVTENKTIVANFTTAPFGAIDGLFSIAPSSQVYFSQGNLQYKASTNTWRFAEHQYDYIGNDNSNISSFYSNYIDLFGWGTSGWRDSGAECYQPWSTSKKSIDYRPGGGLTNLTGNYANADWGVYNAIYNGGNLAGQWRTLLKEEWMYVFQGRNNASSKYGHGKVNGVCGMILLPDNWTLPSGLSFTAGDSSWANSYTADQWAQMEAYGAVFLPAAGSRSGTSVSSVGSYGGYWSASYNGAYNGEYAFGVIFSSGYLDPSSCPDRHLGRSVRLVQDY